MNWAASHLASRDTWRGYTRVKAFIERKVGQGSNQQEKKWKFIEGK